jgi:galactokinase
MQRIQPLQPSALEIVERACGSFTERHGEPPQAVGWAPGRTEILGNHTDYNRGYVLSAAVDLGIAVAAGEQPSAQSNRIDLWSGNLRNAVAADSRDLRPLKGSWANYPLGVLVELQRSGVPVGGLRLVIESSLPSGAGVSSSAALELATAEAVYALRGGRPADPMEEAKLCQRAEVDFAGVPCGLLDQFSSLFGLRDHALFLDCASLEYERLAVGTSDVRLVIADSGVKHALADGEYARLRRSCEDAVRRLAPLLGRRLGSLRDVRLEELLLHAEGLEPDERRRAEHVLRENDRVLRGRDALRRSDLAELGRLMLESHASSRDLFGNSCLELDYLVAEAATLPGFLGGKLCGGGFGGATVHLVSAAEVRRFAQELSARYEQRFRRPLRAFAAAFGDGARGLRLDVAKDSERPEN